MNEYNTVVQAFALQGSNIDQVTWMEAIKKAQVRKIIGFIIVSLSL
jgi:hypothetical protein